MCGSERLCGVSAPRRAPLERRHDLELAAAGWQRRHSAEPARAAESAEFYRALGFEVLTRASAPRDFEPACGACAQLACGRLLVIYTRRPQDAESQSSPSSQDLAP